MSTQVPPAKRVQPGSRTVNLRIKRADGPAASARWEDFAVAVTAGNGTNIIAALQQIAAKPITTGGVKTTPVVWDSGCLEEVCGACTMVVNGHVRQSCSALLDTIAPNDGDTVTLEPMRKFPVVRDLSVDRARLFHNLERARGWVPIDGTYNLGPGPRETPERQETRYTLSTCMSCGCCLDACPQFNLTADAAKWDEAFIGAHAISQARLFDMHETGRQLENDRVEEMAGPGGVNDCGNAQNCVKVCPKKIPLTESIAAMGRAVTIHAFKRLFTLR
ncbi:succinate dehydrogenase iron-sulfur subunit [soil metagenome]